jgi:hypothetical protein
VSAAAAIMASSTRRARRGFGEEVVARTLRWTY